MLPPPEEVKLVGYVDDLTILISTSTANHINNLANQTKGKNHPFQEIIRTGNSPVKKRKL